MNSKIIFGFLFFLLLPAVQSVAQPTLPQIGAVSKDGINILSWMNPYTNGVISVSIQRSADSTFNYETIGLIKDKANASQTFVDSRPALGNNWYRVVVLFSSGTDWISDVVKVALDSNDIVSRKPLLPNDSLQQLLSSMKSLSPAQAVANINQTATYPKSPYVFTNPFTGNVDIDLKDALEKNYVLYFYDQQGTEVLKIPRINDTDVILDKRNFEKPGLYKFKLLKEGKPFAEGYITIY